MTDPTQTTLEGEIASPAHGLKAKLNGRDKAMEALAARKKHREDQKVVLEDGSKVYPDVAPGVGWCLEMPKRALQYMATKEGCLALWRYYRKLEG